jgi:hypothetical protein
MKTLARIVAIILAGSSATLAGPHKIPETLRGCRVMRADATGVHVLTADGMRFIEPHQLTSDERKLFNVVDPEVAQRIKAKREALHFREVEEARQFEKYKELESVEAERHRRALEEFHRTPEGQRALEGERERMAAQHRAEAEAANRLAEEKEKARIQAARAQAEQLAAQVAARQRQREVIAAYMRDLQERREQQLREREVQAAEDAAYEMRMMREEMERRRRLGR